MIQFDEHIFIYSFQMGGEKLPTKPPTSILLATVLQL